MAIPGGVGPQYVFIILYYLRDLPTNQHVSQTDKQNVFTNRQTNALHQSQITHNGRSVRFWCRKKLVSNKMGAWYLLEICDYVSLINDWQYRTYVYQTKTWLIV